MKQSILQPDGEKVCYITGSRINLDCHHCLHGIGNRKHADKYGLWVWLRHDIHMRLHDSDKALDRELEQEAQRAFEKTHTRKEFMKIFGKNYLD